jgi:hypothetical protein
MCVVLGLVRAFAGATRLLLLQQLKDQADVSIMQCTLLVALHGMLSQRAECHRQTVTMPCGTTGRVHCIQMCPPVCLEFGSGYCYYYSPWTVCVSFWCGLQRSSVSSSRLARCDLGACEFLTGYRPPAINSSTVTNCKKSTGLKGISFHSVWQPASGSWMQACAAQHWCMGWGLPTSVLEKPSDSATGC